jgi:hypothetical protein
MRGVLGRRVQFVREPRHAQFKMYSSEIHGTGGNTVCSPNPRYQPSSMQPSEQHARLPRQQFSF